LYTEDRDRILRSVKESVDEVSNRSEDSIYFFVIGVSFAVFAGLILAVYNIKYKTNQLETYGQKIQQEINEPLKQVNKDSDINDLSKQVEALRVALAGRYDFSQFFKDLASNQYKNSKWTSLSLTSQKIAIQMETDNFDDVSKSLKSFEKIKSVQDASLSNVNVNPDNKKVSFTVELKVDFNSYKIKK
jgi:hypothetical protein